MNDLSSLSDAKENNMNKKIRKRALTKKRKRLWEKNEKLESKKYRIRIQR